MNEHHYQRIDKGKIERWAGICQVLDGYTGYFPDDFYGKLGESYFKALQTLKRELQAELIQQ